MRIDKTSELTIKESLITIANDLIINKAIKINDKTFSLIDVEVYYWHMNHQDDFAKGVNHNKEIGELEAHRYGIDISLGNIKDLEFGGILICGLFDNQERTIIEKPLVTRALFNSLKIGENTIEIIQHQNIWKNTFRSKRNNLGIADNDNKRKYSDSFYKFLASERSLFITYKGKESVFKNSELRDEELNELLGYSIKR
jgi:hypothetical protein